MGLYQIISAFDRERAILRLLADNPDGLNIQSISKNIGVNDALTGRIMSALVKEHKVNEMAVGASKVYSLA